MERKQEPSPSDNLAQGVAGLIQAAIGVGAAIAKATAQATARDANCPPPPETDAAPLSVLVHYTLATASNLISLVSAAAGIARKASGIQPATKTANDGIPLVRPGAQLRVPLSVENPSDRPMNGLAPLLRRVLVGGIESSDALPASAVRFTPKSFSVAPKDFEKLTLSVAVPGAAASGRYDLILALGPKEPDLPFSFEVVPADAP